MANTRLIFVGGFLGAGKTTLLYEITRLLKKRGISVGLITNDQAPDLADTALLEQEEINIAEVSGSCFCCDFKALRRAIGKVGKNLKTDVILAEPVGSCTDLSATLINPIKEMMNTEVSVSPLTVLADPKRLKEIFGEVNSSLHQAAAYILRKQLEESDTIVITKTDLYSREEIDRLKQKLKESFPECEIVAVSSKTGEGVEELLNTALAGTNAGKHILDIDYDRYAEGEAVLGWLNCSASLTGEMADWDHFSRELMKSMAGKFDSMHLPVGHVKMMLENGDQYISANLTGSSETLAFRWSAGIGKSAELIVNARVETSPEILKDLFLRSLEETTAGKIKVRLNNLRSISPGYPKPTYRVEKK